MASNKALVRTQTTLRFVCAAQLGRYAQKGSRRVKGPQIVRAQGKVLQAVMVSVEDREQVIRFQEQDPR